MNILYAYAAILLLSGGILAIISTRDTSNDSWYTGLVVVLTLIWNALFYKMIIESS